MKGGGRRKGGDGRLGGGRRSGGGGRLGGGERVRRRKVRRGKKGRIEEQ